jgi:hypothetical protein
VSTGAWVAIASAVVAGLFALQAKWSELRAQSRMEAERRIATSRGETFEPLIERIGDLYDKIGSDGKVTQAWMETELRPTFFRFLRWVQIYGSEAVWASHRLMQAMFHNVPPNVLTRLMGDLVVAARRDLTHPDSKVNALDIMGLRINDVYEHPWAAAPLEQVYRMEGWSPPWGLRFKPPRLAFLRRTAARRG